MHAKRDNATPEAPPLHKVNAVCSSRSPRFEISAPSGRDVGGVSALKAPAAADAAPFDTCSLLGALASPGAGAGGGLYGGKEPLAGGILHGIYEGI